MDILLFAITFAAVAIPSCYGRCLLSGGYPDCEGSMACDGDMINFSQEISSWSCGKSEQYWRDWPGEGFKNKQLYKYVFTLSLNLKNIDLPTLLKDGIMPKSIFYYNYNEKRNESFQDIILEIKIDSGRDIENQYDVFYNFKKLKGITIIFSNLETINLNKYLIMSQLKSLNVSHNSITKIDTENATLKPSSVEIIDLSFNKIETIPDSCFLHFPKLLQLSLAHNYISSMNVLTFEGISHLQKLDLSHNQFLNIGDTFIRFQNLKILSLEFNNLTSINESNFKIMLKLEALDLSWNQIRDIESKSFQTLLNLKSLTMNDNKLTRVTKMLFSNNVNLFQLYLQNNNITRIESESFKGKDVTDFNINNNCLTGALESSTFEGIHTNTLDLSGSNITSLESHAFRGLYVTELNMSSNSLTNVSKSAFEDVHSLKELDLSNNNLSRFNIDSTDLKDLELLDLRNNSIKSIFKNMLRNMTNLKRLDVSLNKISTLEMGAFFDLNKLEFLDLSVNYLVSSLVAHCFQGLSSVKKMYLVNTNVTSIEDEAFSGLSSLNILNVSNGQLTSLGFEVFKNTSSIEILDLSHNLLEHISINTTYLVALRELYLNQNKITKITEKTFYGFSKLEKIFINDNNILKIDSKALFQSTKLRVLDISCNLNMEVEDGVFDNLPLLSEVNMSEIKGHFKFEHSVNASITNLYMSSNNIENVNSINVFKVKNIEYLNLRSNSITFLDRFSFRIMPNLTQLDLSFNLITSIQPGTFLYLNRLTTLNLYSNMLPFVSFGAFDGLKVLTTLNFSKNALKEFSGNLIHNMPFLKFVSLDDNNIESVNFVEFNNTLLQVLSIGGNPISCHDFVEVKKKKYQFIVTAEKLDYHSENANGITCKSLSKGNDTSNSNTIGNSKAIPFTFSKTIEEFQTLIANIANNFSSSINELKVQNKIQAKSTDDILERILLSGNKTNNEFIDKIAMNNNNIANNFSSSINELKLQNKIQAKSTDDILEQILSKMAMNNNITTVFKDDLLNVLRDIKKDYEDNRKSNFAPVDKLSSELKTLFQNVNTHKVEAQTKEESKGLGDVKSLLFFIAIGFALMLALSLFISVYLILNFKKKSFRSNSINNSSHPLTENVIELQNS